MTNFDLIWAAFIVGLMLGILIGAATVMWRFVKAWDRGYAP